MQPPPQVIVFDVNQTLSDMSPLADRFTDIGAPEQLTGTWFAALLRDGFALAAAGSQQSFTRLGTGTLRTLLAGLELNRPIDAAVEHVMTGFAQLPLHPDIPEGVRTLHQAGIRLVTLTNGSTQVADRLFTDAGIRDRFEALLSVEDAGIWKPARAAYEYAARACSVPVQEMLLVAVHPWDIDGAHRAGLATAWINRTGGPYPDYFTRPGLIGTHLGDIAEQILAANPDPDLPAAKADMAPPPQPSQTTNHQVARTQEAREGAR